LTSQELSDLGLQIELGSFVLSLPATYAIIGDKFVRPTVERADAVCALSRGKLTTALGMAMKPFVATGRGSAAKVALVGPDGNPLEEADINKVFSIESTQFQEAVRSFLDASSDDLDRYHRAVAVRTSIKAHWNFCRTMIGLWCVCAGAALGLFLMFSKGVIGLPTVSWLWVFLVLSVAPVAAFIIRIPFLAASCNRLETEESLV